MNIDEAARRKLLPEVHGLFVTSLPQFVVAYRLAVLSSARRSLHLDTVGLSLVCINVQVGQFLSPYLAL